MPRKAMATAAGLVALLVERTELHGENLWAIVALIIVYQICHTVSDVVLSKNH